jgi:hypothetical protein
MRLFITWGALAMGTITTIGAIVVFLVVIGYALNMIKELFKSK